MGRRRKNPRFEDLSDGGKFFVVIIVIAWIVYMIAKAANKH